MMRWKSLGCVLAFAGLGLLGCDETVTPTDAGPTPTDGGGPTDSGPMPGADPVGFGPTLDMLTTADFSCRGTETEPASTGAEVTFTGAVTDFFNGMPIEGLTIHFFGDNAPVSGCTGTCITATSSAAGEVSVMDNEGSWYAYRIEAGSGSIAGAPNDYIELVQFNEATPGAAGSETMNAVQASTRNTIITLLGVMQEPGAATLTGQLQDCNGEVVANATLRAFDSTGTEITLGTGRSGPRAFYFNGDSFPAAAQRASHIDGLYGAANVPVLSDTNVRFEAWGVTTAGGTPEMLGCEVVQVVADGITVVNIGPARSDGPSGCSM